MKARGIRSNEILSDNFEYLEIRLNYGKVLKIDGKDWDHLLSMSSIGKVGMSSTPDGRVYPSARLRKSTKSLLSILFRNPRVTKCISDDWLDIRRCNLVRGEELLWPGQKGYKKLEDDIKPFLTLEACNEIVRSNNSRHWLKVGDSEVYINRGDYADLVQKGVGRIWLKKFSGGSAVPYCKLPDGSSHMALKLIHGENMTYASETVVNAAGKTRKVKDYLDLTGMNVREVDSDRLPSWLPGSTRTKKESK